MSLLIFLSGVICGAGGLALMSSYDGIDVSPGFFVSTGLLFILGGILGLVVGLCRYFLLGAADAINTVAMLTVVLGVFLLWVGVNVSTAESRRRR